MAQASPVAALIIRDNANPRRSPQQIEQLFKDATDSNHVSVKTTNNGIRLNFLNDQDINIIFVPDNIVKMNRVNLSASLAENSQLDREIYIADVPDNIYQK